MQIDHRGFRVEADIVPGNRFEDAIVDVEAIYRRSRRTVSGWRTLSDARFNRVIFAAYDIISREALEESAWQGRAMAQAVRG